MEKKKNSVGTIALVVLLLIVTIASLVLATYAWAKYTSKTTGTASAEVAKWDVTFSDDKEDFIGSYTHIVANKIAPGASGTFDITVDPGATETCFKYVIKIDSFEFVDADGNVLAPATVLEAKTADTAEIDGVKALDKDITVADLREHIVVKDGDTELATNSLINQEWHISSCADKTKNVVAKTISWAWEYQDATDSEYDVVDTAAGRYVAAGNTLKLKFNYTITATQIAPVRQ